ncbi:hypothetical protein AGMMS50262_23680 [Bacteroidia bacterium]|nr:hypothetical protein AGMMS50262_23680 [Bacteroidia bacterium]
MRNPSNRVAYTPGSEPELFLGRGYTGHEHLTQFGLINMNARLYDPAVGRFLSPDPYVQDPFFGQSFNRYSYALNNPFKYTDPSGEFPWLIVGIVAGFTYLLNAQANRDKTPDADGNVPTSGDLSKWEFNPFNWFKSKSGNPNPTGGVVITVGGSSDGSFYMNGSVGNIYGPMPTVGYSSNQGWGIGMSNNGNTNMYYPWYNYNAPEQGAERAYEEARSYFIEVNRFAESENATISQFYARGPVPWGIVSGYVLEPGGPSTTLSGQDKRIPAGTYDIDPYSSKKFPNVYIISGDQVSAKRKILFHSGNYHYNTLGCFLPGSSYRLYDDDYSVSGSRAKLNELRRLLRTNSATMVVRDIP